MYKKVIGLVLAGMMSLSVVGCGNKVANENVSGDDIFIEDFSDAVNKRWVEVNKLAEKFEKEKYTESEYYNKVTESVKKEIEAIEKSMVNIEDKELKKVVENYIQGDKIQIESFKTTDIELQSKYTEEANGLRKPSMVTLVEEYGMVVDEENQQTYKNFKEEATIINKEKDVQEFVKKVANEIVFEKGKNEWGEVQFTAVIENTSDVDFATMQFQVNYKDKDGIVIGNDWIFIENFDANTKQKATLTPCENENDIESIVLEPDYCETK